MKTPVAFIIFNRPDTTKRVFEAIRQAKPPKLLVIADGPRADRPGEAEKCAVARAIIEGVDWECEVLTNYSDVNLGCKIRVSSGLDWVFNTVEEAIIIEDDCVPHITFFQFCEELLELYRHDERIMTIAALNVPLSGKMSEYSYTFSCYNRIWGWASWRRAWKYFDVDMKLWTKVREEKFLNSLLGDNSAVNFWHDIYQQVYERGLNCWGYQWTFACWIQNGLTIIPNVNLVKNIGFGESATHTINVDMNSRRAQLPLEEMSFPLRHPPFVIRDMDAEKWIQKNVHDYGNFLSKSKKKLKKIMKNLSIK
ncbi:MAG: glycosyltransferase family 2 protein [Dolichospermum sp.]